MNISPIEPSVDNNKAWNMAQFFYFSLNKLIEQKDEAYLYGDLTGYLRGLRAILRRTVHKLKDDERVYVAKLLDEARDQLNSIADMPREYQIRSGGLIRRNAEKLMDEADNALTRLMDKYEMIEPRFMMKGVESLERRMKLDKD